LGTPGAPVFAFSEMSLSYQSPKCQTYNHLDHLRSNPKCLNPKCLNLNYLKYQSPKCQSPKCQSPKYQSPKYLSLKCLNYQNQNFPSLTCLICDWSDCPYGYQFASLKPDQKRYSRSSFQTLRILRCYRNRIE
jgi:hypothetical protein